MKKLHTLLLIIIFSISSQVWAAEKPTNKAIYRKFQNIFEKTLKDYVEEPDKEKMLDAALSGMISSLDPYSTYMTGEELEAFVDWYKGEFGGIGVEIIFEGSYAIKIISPIDDLAADKAGIKAGDYIIAVNGETISSLGHHKAVKNLRGDPGTKVKVTIAREAESGVIEYELTREMVKLNPVKYHRDGDIAYVRVTTFNEAVMSEFKKAMRAISKQSKNPLKGVILDLRNNPGGLLDQGVALAEYFLDSGVIVKTKSRIHEDKVYSANKFEPKSPKVPMVVLINSGSASASEVVSGALQDHKRAIIMGTKSFGKASVQQFMPLEASKTALYLTIGKYYTPNGRSINGEGIEPDILVEQAKVQYPSDKKDDEISNKVINNYLNDKKKDDTKKSKNSNKKKSNEMSDIYKRDYQYSRAYDLILGLNIKSEHNEIKESSEGQ